MTELILLRHGKTAHNEKRVYCGSGDPPLSARGIAETKRSAKLLKPFAPHGIYVSDKRRAVQTAHIVAPRGPFVTQSALREINFGAFEGLNADEIARRMPQQWREYMNDPFEFVFPDGDSVAGYLEGAYKAVWHIVSRHDGQRILIVTHKGVITAALSYLLHGDFKHMFHYDIRPSGYAKLDIYVDHSVLIQLNQ